MAKGDIPLHPKYGVNPTIEICFWCQKATGRIALLGNHYKGEAPSHAFLGNYEPCDECKERMAEGFMFIEASREPRPDFKDQPPLIADGIYPTARWFVVRKDAPIEKIFGEDVARDLRKHGRMLVDIETYTELMGPPDNE